MAKLRILGKLLLSLIIYILSSLINTLIIELIFIYMQSIIQILLSS